MSKIDNFISKGKESVKLLFDKKVPFVYKIIPVVSLFYLIYPFDFITDLIPGLGQLDDLAVIGGAMTVFVKMAKKHKNNEKESRD